MKKIFIITVLFVLSISLVKAQEERIDSLKINLNKNSINISGGILGLWVSAHGTYERLFQDRIFGSGNSAILDLGAGVAAFWGGETSYIINRFGILTGSGRRHFEAKAGVGYFLGRDLQGLFPSFSIGYRNQKPGSGYIFRTGLGFPDGLYISWGFSF